MQDRAPQPVRPTKTAFRSSLIAGLFLVTMLAGVVPVQAADVGAVVAQGDNAWGVKTDYTVSWDWLAVLPDGRSNVTVTFPEGFDLSSAEADFNVLYDEIWINTTGRYVQVNDTTPTLLQTVAVDVVSVFNPVSLGKDEDSADYTLNVTITQWDDPDTMVHYSEPTVTIVRETSLLDDAELTFTKAAGATDADGTLTFTAPESASKVQLRFPEGFNVSSHSTPNAVAETDRILTITKSVTEDDAETVSLEGIDLPMYSGELPVTLVLLDGSDDFVSGGIGVFEATVDPGAMTAAYVSSTLHGQSLAGKSPHTLKFDLTFANPTAVGDNLTVQLPEGFEAFGHSVQLKNDSTGLLVDLTSFANTTIDGREQINITPSLVLNASQVYELSLINVNVTPTIGVTEAFVIRTNNTDGYIIDENDDLTFDSKKRGDLVLNAFDVDSATAGARGNVSINVTVDTNIATGVRVVFPDSFDLNASAASMVSIIDANGIDVAPTATGVAGQDATGGGNITVEGFTDKSANDWFIINISNVELPHLIGATDAVSIRTLNESTGAEFDIVDGTLTLTKGLPDIGQIFGALASPENLAGDDNGNYTIPFTPHNPADEGDLLVVTFPAGFDLGGLDVTGETTDVEFNNTDVNGTDVSISGNELRIVINETNGYEAYEMQWVNVTGNVTNPGKSGPTENFTVTLKASGTTVLEENVSAAANNPELEHNSFDAASIVGSPGTSNQTSTFTLTLTTNNTIPSGASLNVTFPDGFNVSAATGFTVNGVSASGEANQTEGGREVNVTVPSSIGRNASVTLAIPGVAHGAAGDYALNVESRATDFALIDQNLSVPFTINPGELQVTLIVNDTKVGATAQYKIGVTVGAGLSSTSQFNLSFPEGFDLSGVADGDITSSRPTSFKDQDIGGNDIVVRFTDGVDAGSSFLITVNNVVNAGLSGETEPFMMATNATTGDLDENNDETVTLTAQATIAAASIDIDFTELARNATGGVNITFPNATALADGDIINITFPEEFDVTGIDDATSDLGGEVLTGQVDSTTFDNTVQITIDGTDVTNLAATQEIELNLTGVVMPRLSGAIGEFTVRTISGSLELETGTKTPTDLVTATNFDSVDVVAYNNGLGAIANYDIIVLPNDDTDEYRKGETLEVTFPSGYTFPAGVTYDFNYGTAERDGTTNKVVATFDADTANTPLTLNVEGIKNPTTGTSSGAFTIQTLNGTAVMETNTTESVALEVAPSLDFSATTVSVAEDGTATFTIGLGKVPTGTVQLNLASGDGNIATVSPATLTYTDSKTAQTVTVSGVDNDLVDGARATTITVSVDNVGTTDSDYDSLSNEFVTVNVADDDSPAIVVTGSPASVKEEGATSDTIDVKLATKPTSSVTITVTSGSADFTFSPSTLTFTTSNYGTNQAITVTAVDDAVSEGSESGTLTLTPSSSDSDYDDLAAATATVSITDNDQPSVAITESGTTTEVAEGSGSGNTDTYTVVLEKQPSASVTVTVNASEELDTDKETLTFTTANWNTAQTVTISAVDDDELEGDHSGIIRHTAESSDSGYDGISISSVIVSISDNDAGIIVTETGGDTEVEEGETDDDLYRLRLSTEPTDEVNITVTPADGLTADVAFLLFNSTNWDNQQTVRVTATDNEAIDGDRVLNITHTSESDDDDYDGLEVVLEVNVTDDDSEAPDPLTDAEIEAANKGVTVTVTRSGSSNRITWVLPASPPADVEGVQIWFSNSPYALLQTYDKDSTVFSNKAFTHLGEDALATTKYLVTMYYADGAGRFSSSDAPDTDTYAGISSEGDEEEDDKITSKWWFWLLIVLAVLIVVAIIVVIVLMILRNRSEEDEDYDDWEDDDVGWDEGDEDEEEAPEVEVAPEPVGESHHIHCPRCSNEFDAVGEKPLTTTCPNCNARGILR